MTIIIDTDKKTIFFRNIITRQAKLYLFDGFDGYVDTLVFNPKTLATYKVIYLIKQKRAKKLITGFYYSNMDELQAALNPIKYLGFQKNFSALFRKAFLNKKIIE